MKQYLDLVQRIFYHGQFRADRTGVGCRGIFGAQMRFDLSVGFPLVTVKSTWFHGVKEELLWMLRGETNIKPLVAAGVHIWDEWADLNGDLGPVYGAQWRGFKCAKEVTDSESDQDYALVEVDQIADLIANLKKDPFSRRHVITAWQPGELPMSGTKPKHQAMMGLMALAPCHCLFQFNVRERDDGEKVLDCQLYQRSCDVFLGVPFNIASYALLTMMVAHHVGMTPGDFIWTGGDVHLYTNHEDQATEMLTRRPFFLPRVRLEYPEETPLWDVKGEYIMLDDYRHHPAIKAPVAV